MIRIYLRSIVAFSLEEIDYTSDEFASTNCLA